MYAVVQSGGKQYRVTPGQIIKIEKIEADVDSAVDIEKVLMIHDGKEGHYGQPLLENAKIVGRVVEQSRAKKIIVFKKKRRQNYRRKKGHRQHQTVLQVSEFFLGGKSLGKAEPKPASAAQETTVKKAPKQAKTTAEPASTKAAPEKKTEKTETK